MAVSRPRNASVAGPAASGGLRIVPHKRAGETTLTIEREDSIPPNKSFFADFVHVEDNLNDVTMIFGKLRPKMFADGEQLRFAIEVSFPHGHFCEQFDDLIREGQDGQPSFLESLNGALAGRLLERKPATMPKFPSDNKEFGGVRANAAFLYLQDEEACIDFFYLDAATMHGMRNGSGPTRIPGLLRVLLTPAILLLFLNRCIVVAEEIRSSTKNLSAREET